MATKKRPVKNYWARWDSTDNKGKIVVDLGGDVERWVNLGSSEFAAMMAILKLDDVVYRKTTGGDRQLLTNGWVDSDDD